MTLIFHLMVGFAIIIFQTALFPCLGDFALSFDLFLPVVVYLGLFRSVKESLIPLIFQGLVMDSLSGAPPGVYLSCYCWLFAAVYWFKGFLHIRNPFLLALVVSVSVAVQHGLLASVHKLPLTDWDLLSGTFRMLTLQILPAMILGPWIILRLQDVHDWWKQHLSRYAWES